MNHRKSNAVIVECKIFLQLAHSSYTGMAPSSGEELFNTLNVLKSSQLDSTARKVISKFKSVSSQATQRLQYRAIVKVIWRYMRDKTELGINSERRLFLMILAFSSLTVGARKAMTSTGGSSDVDMWRNEIASWLGEQLAKYYHNHHESDAAHKLFTNACLPFFD